MLGLEDRLNEIGDHIENYEQKLEGLQKVVEKYRNGEVTYEGLMYASNEVAREETEIEMEIEDFNPADYVVETEFDEQQIEDRLEGLYKEELEYLEDRLDELEEKRKDLLQNR